MENFPERISREDVENIMTRQASAGELEKASETPMVTETGEASSTRNTSSSSDTRTSTATDTERDCPEKEQGESPETSLTETKPRNPETEEIARRRKVMEQKTSDQLLKETLALSREECNRLISEQTKSISELTETNRKMFTTLQSTICKKLGEFLTNSQEISDGLVKNTKESSESLVKKTRETTDSLIDAQKGLSEKLESAVRESVSELEKKTTDAITGLQKKTEEISVLYQKVLETSLGEIRDARTALSEATEREAVTKKETADLIRTNIEASSRGLTEYYKKELAGSVSNLNAALKKTREDIEELGRKEKRERKLARVMRVATPVLLFVACVISIVGLFV